MDETLVTQLKFPMTFDVERLKQDLAQALKQNWIAHYNPTDYSGDWNLIALMSCGGDQERIQAFPISGMAVIETEILQQCPYFKEVIDSFQFPKTTARLMRLQAGAVIKPHTDYCLGYEDGVFRIHIPVVTNPDVEFIIAGKRVIMEEGTCWYINANKEHSVANRGTEDRVHLVIDGQRNAWTDELFFSLAPEAHFQRPAPKLNDRDKKLMIEELKRQDTPVAREMIQRLEEELNS